MKQRTYKNLLRTLLIAVAGLATSSCDSVIYDDNDD